MGTVTRRARRYVVALALGLGAVAGGAAPALAAGNGEVSEIECRDLGDAITLSGTCAYQEATRTDKVAVLADLALFATCSACVVAGFWVVK